MSDSIVFLAIHSPHFEGDEVLSVHATHTGAAVVCEQAIRVRGYDQPQTDRMRQKNQHGHTTWRLSDRDYSVMQATVQP